MVLVRSDTAEPDCRFCHVERELSSPCRRPLVSTVRGESDLPEFVSVLDEGAANAAGRTAPGAPRRSMTTIRSSCAAGLAPRVWGGGMAVMFGPAGDRCRARRSVRLGRAVAGPLRSALGDHDRRADAKEREGSPAGCADAGVAPV